MQPYLTDAALTVTGALPASAGSTLTGVIDTMNSQYGDNDMSRAEWEIDAPALNTTQLPNSATVSYAVVMSNSSTLGSPTVIYDNVIVQTGAGGVGAAAKTARFRLPIQPGGQNATLRYMGIRATTATSPGDCSGATMTLLPRF